MYPNIKEAHLRIQVETRLKGKLITAKDIEANPSLLNNLPDRNSFQIVYQRVLSLANDNLKHYLITVSEEGIITTIE